MEVETMDASINSEKDSISIPTCPLCRKPVINTPRYKDLIIRKFRTEINPVKERIYGSVIQRQQKKETLMAKVINLHSHGCADKEWEKVFIQIYHNIKKNEKNESILTLQVFETQVDVLGVIANVYNNYKNYKPEVLQNAFANQFAIICKFISENLRKFSEQHQNDVGKEIKRLNAIGNLSKILSHSSYLSSKDLSKVSQLVENVKTEVLTWKSFDEEKSKNLLENLKESINLNGIMSIEEIKLIVKAIGLPPGRWYKCPNGHFYCIGNCGLANQVLRCPDCKAQIGGTAYRLLGNNRRATEID